MTDAIRAFGSLRSRSQYGLCLTAHGAAAVDHLAADV